MSAHLVYQDDWLVHVVLKDGRVYLFITELWYEWLPENSAEACQQAVFTKAINEAEFYAARNTEAFCRIDVSQSVGAIQTAISTAAMAMSDSNFRRLIR